jgi:hypothetical protein
MLRKRTRAIVNEGLRWGFRTYLIKHVIVCSGNNSRYRENREEKEVHVKAVKTQQYFYELLHNRIQSGQTGAYFMPSRISALDSSLGRENV